MGSLPLLVVPLFHPQAFKTVSEFRQNLNSAFLDGQSLSSSLLLASSFSRLLLLIAMVYTTLLLFITDHTCAGVEAVDQDKQRRGSDRNHLTSSLLVVSDPSFKLASSFHRRQLCNYSVQLKQVIFNFDLYFIFLIVLIVK